MFVRALLGLLALSTLATPAAAAKLTYSFSTDEPFAGGMVSFSYTTDSPPAFDTFIEASALSSYSSGLARIRFSDACFTFVPGSSSSVACDAVQVIVNTSFGSTSLNRQFQDGSLARPGDYANLSGTPARLVVTPAAVGAGVPEPATWAMMIFGFALSGAGLRRRQIVRNALVA